MNDSTTVYNTLMTGNKSFRKAMGSQVEQLIQAQASALDRLEELSGDWYSRRREALESISDIWSKASQVNNAAELWSLYGNWLSGEMNRLSSDFSALTQQVTEMGEQSRTMAASLGRNLQEAGQKAAGETVAGLQQTGEKAAAAAKRGLHQEAA